MHMSLTVVLCAMDLAFGIIFGIDYDAIRNKAYAEPIDANPPNLILIAAQTASMVMMIVALKGFVLWLLNFGLALLLAWHAKSVATYFDSVVI